MSMVAVFAMDCCQREVTYGRFRGSEVYPPTMERCPFGCEPKFLRHQPQRAVLRFLRYESEQ